MTREANTPEANTLIEAFRTHLPAPMRWAGALARRMRGYDISLEGKSSGSANTDALTLADLMVQELIVGALRDADPCFRQCRIEAEEATGDLHRFAANGRWTIALDPIDGTKHYRDRIGSGYSVMLHVRDEQHVLYSLVFLPEQGSAGSWLEVFDQRVAVGEDDPSRPAEEVVRGLPAVDRNRPTTSKRIYLIGFQQHDARRAAEVTAAGLEGVPPDQMPGAIHDLMARGDFAGSLIHTPNVYDFPVCAQMARILGGDAVWVHNGEPVHFRETWLDERADMLRLPGIVACSPDRSVLRTLVELARDWNPVRYAD